jgi:HEPN domain-containing protein
MQLPTEQAARLLALAKRDKTSFKALASHPEVDISATGFFAQQVVEKCLKAVAAYHGLVFRRTHDVARLASIVQTLNDEIARLREVGTGKAVELVRQ